MGKRRVFKTTLYKVRIGPTGMNDGTMNIAFNAFISVGGEDEHGAKGELTIYFIPDGGAYPSPAGTVNDDCDRGSLFVPLHMLPYYIDVLRNEKPVSIVMNTNWPANSQVVTGWERIGAEDENT